MTAPLTARERRMLLAYRNRAIQTARAYLHHPDVAKESMAAQYSNGIVLRIVDAVVKLPWQEPKKKKRSSR